MQKIVKQRVIDEISYISDDGKFSSGSQIQVEEYENRENILNSHKIGEFKQFDILPDIYNDYLEDDYFEPDVYKVVDKEELIHVFSALKEKYHANSITQLKLVELFNVCKNPTFKFLVRVHGGEDHPNEIEIVPIIKILTKFNNMREKMSYIEKELEQYK